MLFMGCEGVLDSFKIYIYWPYNNMAADALQIKKVKEEAVEKPHCFII